MDLRVKLIMVRGFVILFRIVSLCSKAWMLRVLNDEIKKLNTIKLTLAFLNCHATDSVLSECLYKVFQK